jgi:hypothetical protein
MIRVCYRCKKVMGEKEPLEDKSETHGLCDECLPIEMKQIEEALEALKKAGWTPGMWNN